jgi:hypothetical protein
MRASDCSSEIPVGSQGSRPFLAVARFSSVQYTCNEMPSSASVSFSARLIFSNLFVFSLAARFNSRRLHQVAYFHCLPSRGFTENSAVVADNWIEVWMT